MRRLLWILLALLTVSLLVLVLQRNEAALAELSRFASSSFETKIMAVALVGLIALTLFRQRFSHVLESLLIWAMLGALLALGYTYRFELREVADRVLAELIPGYAATRGRAVEIARASGGGFSVAAQVNGARVPMVLDTGARQRPCACGTGHAGPSLYRRYHRAVGPRARGARRATSHQSTRHDVPQSAGKLGSTRRQAHDARLSVTIIRSG